MERIASELKTRERSSWFRWYACGLLLLATTINYMDRQTLSTASKRLKNEFPLTNEQYGQLEQYFGLAFAAGALVFGFVADATSVRWLYPAVLVAWSVMGIVTGWTHSFNELLWCRTLLGFFEAGHWPCALRTTQRLLTPSERTLGNSILQSGSSIGAILTPIVMLMLLSPEAGSWRFAFQVIGAIGLGWAVLWLMSMRESDLAAPVNEASKKGNEPSDALSTASLVQRLIVLVVVVICINACWHFFRVWLPLFLQEGRGYSESFALGFTSVYYVATDVGCIAGGFLTVWLHQRGMSIGWSRWLVFVLCSLLTALSVAVAFLPAGTPLLTLLLLNAAGSLGLFPCFYALSQEISSRHQGKITGMLGTIAWLTSFLHAPYGKYVDEHHSFDLGIAVVGCLPLVAAIVWLVVWDWHTETKTSEELV